MHTVTRVAYAHTHKLITINKLKTKIVTLTYLSIWYSTVNISLCPTFDFAFTKDKYSPKGPVIFCQSEIL